MNKEKNLKKYIYCMICQIKSIIDAIFCYNFYDTYEEAIMHFSMVDPGSDIKGTAQKVYSHSKTIFLSMPNYFTQFLLLISISMLIYLLGFVCKCKIMRRVFLIVILAEIILFMITYINVMNLTYGNFEIF